MPTYKKQQDGVNGCVFFFRIANTDHVFIGTSTTNNPRMRYGQLSRLIPYKLDLVGCIRTGQFLDMQNRLRSEFADAALLNGWYNLPPDVLAATFSRESVADVSEVRDMVLKGMVVALDATGGFVATEEKGSVEEFLEAAGYFVGTGYEVLFRGAYREYVLACDEPVSLGDFRRSVSDLGFKRTYDNGGFNYCLAKKGVNNE